MSGDEGDSCGAPTPSECSCGGGEEDIKLETAPFDSRFPNQNQTKYCYVSFLDYHRCLRATKDSCGNSNPVCEYFKKVYKSICPNAWHQKWDEQLENGTFAGMDRIKS